jgi:hypothetical protein
MAYGDRFKVLRFTKQGVVIPSAFLKKFGFVPFKIEGGKVKEEGTKFVCTVYEDGTIELAPVQKLRRVK